MSVDIPMPLYRLVKRIMSAFYTPEVSLVMDLLVRKVVLNEDELSEILRFDKKQLRQFLHVLKGDKFVKLKLRILTGDDGKLSKQNYYFINYKEFVNAIKYKLDMARKKIETQERYATARAAYICSDCKKTFTDFDIDQLMDFSTDELKCTFCGATVVEDSNQDSTGISRNILARFNETLEPIFTLLRDIEDIRLGAELLDPEIRQKTSQQPHIYDNTFTKGKWADKNKNIFGYSTQDQQLTVKIDDTINSAAAPAKKEQPEWMKVSTIEGASNFEEKNPTETVHIMSNKRDNGTSGTLELNDSDEIIQILIAFEHPNEMIWNRIRERFGFNLHSRSKSFSWDHNKKRTWNFKTDDMFDNFSARACGKQLRLSDVNDRYIKLMNDDERRDYLKIGRTIYQHNFEV